MKSQTGLLGRPQVVSDFKDEIEDFIHECGIDSLELEMPEIPEPHIPIQNSRRSDGSIIHDAIKDWKQSNERALDAAVQRLDKSKEEAKAILQRRLERYCNKWGLYYTANFLGGLDRKIKSLELEYSQRAKQAGLNDAGTTLADATPNMSDLEEFRKQHHVSELRKYQSLFYRNLSRYCQELREQINSHLEDIRPVVNCLSDIVSEEYRKSKYITLPAIERVNAVNDRELSMLIANNIREAVIGKIVEYIVSGEEQKMDANALIATLDKICEDAVAEFYLSDIESMLFDLLGAEEAEEKLEDLRRRGVPLCRINPLYPRDYLESVSVVGAEDGDRIHVTLSRFISELVATREFAEARTSIPLIQTQHCAALHALDKITDYQRAYLTLIEKREVWHIDKRVQYDHIAVGSAYDSKYVLPFALGYAFGIIEKQHLIYQVLLDDREPIALAETGTSTSWTITSCDWTG